LPPACACAAVAPRWRRGSGFHQPLSWTGPSGTVASARAGPSMFRRSPRRRAYGPASMSCAARSSPGGHGSSYGTPGRGAEGGARSLRAGCISLRLPLGLLAHGAFADGLAARVSRRDRVVALTFRLRDPAQANAGCGVRAAAGRSARCRDRVSVTAGNASGRPGCAGCAAPWRGSGHTAPGAVVR
jgi:hypothetical protein